MEEELQIPDSIAIPFVVGTIAQVIETKKQKANEDGNIPTHKWLVYVRGHKKFDLSGVLEKVIFVLHDTFKDNEKTVNSYPFEHQNTGWGEFEMKIVIYFKKPFNKEPVEIIHKLQLHHLQPAQEKQKKNEKPVVNEEYEEIVFLNPTIDFYNTAMKSLEFQDDKEKEEQENAQKQHEYHQYFNTFDTENHTTKLDDALNVVQQEVDRLQEEMKKKDDEIAEVYKEINKYTLN